MMNTLDTTPLTANEREWVETFRIMTADRVPAPTLRAVQALRIGLARRDFICPCSPGEKSSHATSTPQNAFGEIFFFRTNV